MSATEAGTSHQISFAIGDYREIVPLCDDMLRKCESRISSGSEDTVPGSYGTILLYIYLIPSMIRNAQFRQNVIEPLLFGGAKVVVWCYLPGAVDGMTGAEWPHLWKEDAKSQIKIYWKGGIE